MAAEKAKGMVKHILLAKFKDEVPPQKVDELIKDHAKLVHLIPSMKAFYWGKDVSIENLHQGFTHVFEVTFDSVEGIGEYISHPAHDEFVKIFKPYLEKAIVIDYTPQDVQL